MAGLLGAAKPIIGGDEAYADAICKMIAKIFDTLNFKKSWRRAEDLNDLNYLALICIARQGTELRGKHCRDFEERGERAFHDQRVTICDKKGA